MTKEQIQRIQKKIGVLPDGWWGPKSMAACQRHLRGLMPKPPVFPRAGTSSMTAFYGPPGEKVPLVKVHVPFDMFLYDSGRPVDTISVHEKTARSLSSALEDIARAYPNRDALAATGLTKFFGSYVNRPQRGGTAPSKHAWGAAVDFDATRNGLHSPWPTKSHMPFEVMEIFARHGWINLGWVIWRDAMHFQATQ